MLGNVNRLCVHIRILNTDPQHCHLFTLHLVWKKRRDNKGKIPSPGKKKSIPCTFHFINMSGEEQPLSIEVVMTKQNGIVVMTVMTMMMIMFVMMSD